ncbi:MAG: ABC transporter permease [Bacteroidetes bacterium]|nr:ABC transporter permease [Bacteroidota bacterium]
MFKNYLLTGLKNLQKHKVFSLINIVGLTVGIACCIMIAIYIKHELSYDNFHTNSNNTYRIVRVSDFNGDGNNRNIGWVSGPYAAALRNDYAEAIQHTVRILPDNDLFAYQNNSFNEQKVYLADSNFFNFFSFPLLKGNATSVLNDPASIVLTASTAKKYFGNDDPMGKVITMNEKLQLKVTGIAKDAPLNSHLSFDMVVPLSNFRQYDSVQNFPNNGLYTYIQLNPNVNVKQLESHFPQFMDKYLGKYFAANGFKIGLAAEPMNKVYFNDTDLDGLKHGSKKTIWVFTLIGILILVIACINFMNLASARATDRSKEVGLRKVLGAVRKQLVQQFILDSFLYVTISCILALLVVQLLLPAFGNLLGHPVTAFWSDPALYIFLAAVILVIGLLAGIYPALVLSSFSPIESLKGKLKVGNSGAFFRKGLVIFQFSVSVMLIIGIIIISVQMNYVRNKDLGFNKEQTLLVRIDNRDIYKEKQHFKQMVEAEPGVASVSLMSGEPGGFHDRYGFEAEAKPGEKLLFNTEFSDFEYVKTLGLKIIAGRNFSPDYPADSTGAVLINRSAATNLGYTPEQAVGKWIKNTMRDTIHRSIVGVVEDFHFASLKEQIGPMIFSTYKDWRVAVIRLKPGNNLQATVKSIGKVYAASAPAYPFEYSFLDKQFDGHYKDEIREGTILSVFSTIAILVACLGLFGLASYTAVKRTKEIGVRKVLGSSIPGIVLLLSKDLLKPVFIGTAIAIPAGYYFMNNWLQGFAYRISIQWWMVAAAAIIAVGIALLTVSYQAIKAALANPVQSLRSE